MNRIERIQTLRGIAVLLVVFAHWGLFFGSGYIGVDVFFVISGYVVTLVTLKKFVYEPFRVARFMRARFLRLFPALGATVLVVVFFQLLYYPSFEWSRAAEEGVWSTLWASNFFSYARLGDYFGENAGTALLLHTWSLSVEFQAYGLLATIFFMSLARTKSVQQLQLVLAILGTASLAVALASQLENLDSFWQAVSSYYSPITRFYQIAAGALVATVTPSSSSKRSGTVAMGAVVVVGIALVPENLIAWNLAGLTATLGAIAFILVASSESKLSLVERFLARIGDYSYSIYLWHWPVLVICQSLIPERLSQFTIGFGLTALLSFLSNKFFEKPFLGIERQKRNVAAKSILVFSTAASLCSALVVSSIVWSDIKPTNFDSTQGVLGGDVTQLGFAREFNEIVRPCFGSKSKLSNNVGQIYECYETSSARDIDLLLLGNSHAAHLIPGIVSVNPTVKLRYLSFSGGFEAGNKKLTEALDYWVESGATSKVLFINSFWEIEDTSADEILRAISASNVPQRSTYIFNDVPNFKISPVRCKYAVLFPLPASCSEKLSGFKAHLDIFQTKLSSELSNVNLVNSASHFELSDNLYSMTRNGQIFFRDQNHLNVLGSRSLFRYLESNLSVPDLS